MSDEIHIIEQETLNCGCVIGRAMVHGTRMMTIKPCSDTCVYYKFLLELGREMGKPIEQREQL